MKKRRKAIGQSTYGCSFRADSTTYGLSDGKVATIIVDIGIIIDEVSHADVRLVGQTIACPVRGGCVERTLGGELSRAHSITS